MSSDGLLHRIAILLCFLQCGQALKCHVSQCRNTTFQGVIQSHSCSPNQTEVTCPPVPGINVPADRCMTMRMNIRMPNPLGPGFTEIWTETRNCTSSVMCSTAFRDLTCKAVNQSFNYTGLTSCEMGCCEGDLCNSGGPIPTLPPAPTGPSGSDLSCYACSNLPNIPGVVTAQGSCSSPSNQTCGDDLIPGVKQNQCLRLSLKLGGKPYELRNCSGFAYCNQAVLCGTLKSLGPVSDCKVSCCSGSLCNHDAAPTTTVTSPVTTMRSTGEVKVTSASGIPKANRLMVPLVVLVGSLIAKRSGQIASQY